MNIQLDILSVTQLNPIAQKYGNNLKISNRVCLGLGFDEFVKWFCKYV